MASCRYPHIECQHDAWEEDPHGFCLLHSRQDNKDEDGKFTDAIKRQLSLQNYDFQGVFFSGPIDLSRDSELNIASFFSGAKFIKKANFYRAIFTGTTNFYRVIFLGTANFDGAIFQREANFSSAIFTGDAGFCGATFQGEALFSFATFNEEAYFYQASFQGKAYFVTLNPDEQGKASLPAFSADFQHLILGPEATLVFRDVSLARTNFLRTDMRCLSFHHVNWYSYHAPALVWLLRKLPASWCKWFPGRQAIFDEIHLREDIKGCRRWFIGMALKYGRRAALLCLKTDGNIGPWQSKDNYAQVEELYQGLKQNYEKVGDYKRVGDFYYGEMEMYRRGNPWRRWFSWYPFYWALSGYGERPLRAFIWLLLLIPAWAGLVWGLGIDQAGAQAPVNYGDALLFIFEKATLQRPPWTDIQDINWLGKLLASLSVLLLPGQAALFILALRNRLGRRR